MRTDIEKLVAKHEEELQCAIESNKVYDVLGREDFWVTVDSYSFMCKGKKSLRIRPEDFTEELTINDASLILHKFPVTEKMEFNVGRDNKMLMDYGMMTSRGYRDNCSKLDITYISNDYCVSFEIPVDTTKELNGYFADSSRKICDSEITTYYVVSRPGRKASEVTIPIKVFANGEYVRFQGGRVRSKSEWAVNNIIDAIKSASVCEL